MRSRSGAEFRIFISKPSVPPPPGGFPVIYHLDANAAFATLADALALQSARPEATGVEPAVLVGIGYPTDRPLDPVRRTFDYTPDVDGARLAPRPDGTAWPPTGGAAAFLGFIEEDLKPAIAAEFAIDPARQALFGHSFGGLFALYALFHRPGAFRSIIAASPSIWFGGGAILDSERAFTAALGEGHRDVRVMIAVGALEQTLSARESAEPDGAKRAQWLAQNRMVDNARDMADRLGALASRGVAVTYAEFPGETHVSVLPAVLSRALRFALERSP